MWRSPGTPVSDLSRLVPSLICSSLLVVVSAGALGVSFAATTERAADVARVEGRVVHQNGRAAVGVEVRIVEIGAREVTDDRGLFRFADVVPGEHEIVFERDGRRDKLVIRPSASETLHVDHVLSWDPLPVETIVVRAAGRRRERFVEAPSAISALTPEEIEALGATGDAARLVENVTGVDFVQAGAGWSIVNARGFNAGLNRRLLILVDGRDISTPFLRAPEWGNVRLPLDDLASVELVRGPGSALYGTDAFNGVLVMSSRPPQLDLGGFVRVLGGEQRTRRVDARHSGEIVDGWFYRVAASRSSSETFSVSRVESVEYARPCRGLIEKGCLPLDAVPLLSHDGESSAASVRVDGRLGRLGKLTLETAASSFERGDASISAPGRFQVADAERSWLRVHYESPRWTAHLIEDRRSAEQLMLSAGTRTYLDHERRTSAEVQTTCPILDGRGTVVAGGSYRREQISSAGPDGRESLLLTPVDGHSEAAFAQLDLALSPRWRAVAALRWDDGSHYDGQLSTRAALYLDLGAGHALVASHGRAFLAPNYGELALFVPVATPIDLRHLEGICAEEGVSCGFDAPTPVVAVGNESLDVERVETLELGYRGVWSGRTLVTAQLYSSTMRNFLTDLLPSIHPRLGRLNDDYGAYRPPDELSDAGAEALRDAIETSLPPEIAALLSHGDDGAPLFVALTYGNHGRVRTTGFELGVFHRLARDVQLSIHGTWFDESVDDELDDQPLVPNTPRLRAGVALSYRNERWRGRISWRWADRFTWRTGLYWGEVPAHDVVRLDATWRVAGGWSAGLDVDNVFDDRHIQIFGGDVLRRRAMLRLRYEWPFRETERADRADSRLARPASRSESTPRRDSVPVANRRMRGAPR